MNNLNRDITNLRIYELMIIFITLGIFGLYINYVFKHQDLPIKYIFLNIYFILFLAGLILSTYLHLYIWKYVAENAESVIYEIIIYRKMTSLNAIAAKLQISKDLVYEIIRDMLKKGKLLGEIRNGIYYSTTPKTPICPICKEEILDSLRLIVCPFCRKPFHKDHLISYLNDVEERCPNCKRILTLADLYIDE
ncbi:MAG: RING finger protein [Promethearchaeota archaeon]